MLQTLRRSGRPDSRGNRKSQPSLEGHNLRRSRDNCASDIEVVDGNSKRLDVGGILGYLWGGWMLAWRPLWKQPLPRDDVHIRRGLPHGELLGLALVSLGFGLTVTLHWRAFRWPLLWPTGTSIVGGAAVAWWICRKVRSARCRGAACTTATRET